MNPKTPIWTALTAAVFTGGLVFLFLPSELWLRNPTEFVSTPATVLGDLVLWGLVVGGVLFLPVMLPVAGWRRAWSGLVGGMAFALWVSAVFLVPELGALDGVGFNLELQGEILTRHSILFGVVLVAGCVVAWLWPNYLGWGLAILALGLTVTTVNNFHAIGNLRDKPFETVDPRVVSRFSTDSNLMILVLDTFQSDLLQSLIERDPGLREQLDGFEFFPDTLGVAPSTYLTMPAFHSGRPYHQMMSLQEFYDIGVRQGSFLAELARDGYQVDIVNPIAGACPQGAHHCKSQEHLLFNARNVALEEASRLADLAVLRAIPGVLKMIVFDGKRGLVTSIRDENQLTGLEQRIFMSNTILELVIDHLRVDDGPPTARLIHLLNTHPPFMLDSQCEYIGVQKAINRSLQLEQTACAMIWVLRLFAAMQDAGVYDNSMIILTADTGSGNIYADDDLSSLFAQRHGLEPGEMGRLIGGANPVLAIKVPGSRGLLRESGLQAQLTDIPRTVCETLGDCRTSRGINLATAEHTLRTRTYHYYQWRHEYWGLKSIPGISQYTVRGPLWLESSWSDATPGGEPDQIIGLDFSHRDDPEIFGPGWSYVEVANEETSKRWVTTNRAHMFLPLSADRDLMLEFSALAAPGLADQRLSVRLNGTTLEEYVMEEGLQVFKTMLPVANLQADTNELVFEFSKLRPPQGADVRNLAAAFYELNIYR